jgi:hypothetical protein
VRHKGVHALLVGAEEGLASVGTQRDGLARLDEISRGDHAGVDGGEHGRVGDQGTKRLHQVKCQGRTPEPRLMVVAEKGVEPDRMTDNRQVLGQNAVGQRQQGVDRVLRWTAIAVGEVEGKLGSFFARVASGIAGLDHAGEKLEVDPRGVAFQAQKLLERCGVLRIIAQSLHLGDAGRGRLDVVALEHRSLVADLADHQITRQAQAKSRVVGQTELLAAQGDVADAQPLGGSVKPSSLREEANRHLTFTQGLDRLGGELDVAEQADLASLADAHLLNHSVLFLDLQHVARLADVQALGVEIKRSQVVAGGDEPAGRLGFRLVKLGFRRALARRGRRGGGFLDETCFVGQADTDERTAGALRALDQRSRDGASRGRGASPGDGRERLREEWLVDRQPDSLPGPDVIDNGLVTVIAVVSENKGLDGELNAVGVPGRELAGLPVFQRRPALVIDGRGRASLGLDEVDGGDQPVGLAGKRDRTAMNAILLRQLAGRNQLIGPSVELGMPECAFDGLLIVGEDALDPLVIKQARTVDELVEHPRGQVVG